MKYIAISKWTNPDNSESWDVINVTPMDYDDALQQATIAGQMWNNEKPDDIGKHHEYVVSEERYNEMLNELQQ